MICIAVAVAVGALVGPPCYAQTDTFVQLGMLDTPTDDLIRMATSYADALRDLKAARLSIDTVQTLRSTAIVTNLEVQIASFNLEAAERKANILRAIVQKQLVAAKNKLKIVKYLEGLGPRVRDENGNDRNFIRANDEATVNILEMILAMN